MDSINETSPLKIREVVTLRKFDGDPPAEGEEKEPIETIELVVENGVVVSRKDIKQGE